MNRGSKVCKIRNFSVLLNAQQKGSRFEVGGLGGWELTRSPTESVHGVRKRPRPNIVAKRNTVVAFGLVLRFRKRLKKVSTVSGTGGRVVVAKRRPVVTFVLALGPRCQQSRGWGGDRGRETQYCRHLWTGVESSHVERVNNLRDRGRW